MSGKSIPLPDSTSVAASVAATTSDIVAKTSPVQTATGLNDPYPPSWLNRLMWWVDRLPGPSWAWYVAATVAVAGMAFLANEAVGLSSGNASQIAAPYYGVLLVACVWVPHYLDGVARRALLSFRPATDMDDAAAEGLLYELTVIPAKPVLGLTVLGFVVTAVTYTSDPAGTGVDRLTWPALLTRGVIESLISALILILAYHTLRQLRIVDRLHSLVDRVDLFRPAPLYAFSGVTSQTAIAIILLVVAAVAASPQVNTEQSVLLVLPWVIGFGAVATGAFAWPLRGMHARMVAEKVRMQDAVGARLVTTIAHLHEMADGSDFTRAIRSTRCFRAWSPSATW